MSRSHPFHDEAESLQPSMQQNQSRSSPRPPRRRNSSPSFDVEDGFRDLSPATTLRTIFASSESALPLYRSEVKLMESIETASSLEKAFGKRVAESSKSLRIWCNEIEAWPWNGDFEVPQAEGDTENHATAIRDLVDCLRDADRASNNNFWGSLPAQQVVSYEERLDAIRDDLEDLDIEEQKNHVLHVHMQKGTSSLPHIPTDSPSGSGYVNLDGLTALITETILQALPYYSRLMSLTDMWSVRLAVLRQIPVFLKELDGAQKALDAAWIAIEVRQDRIYDRGMFRESLESIRNGLGEKLSILGQRIDTMLDMIEGCEETLPEKWIDLVEEFEIDYSSWMVEAQAKGHQYEHRQDQVNNPVKVEHQISATSEVAAIRKSGRIPGAWIDEGEEELLDSENVSFDESELEDSDHATPKDDQATYHGLEPSTMTFVSRQRHDNHNTQHSTSQLRVPRPPLFPSTGSKSTTTSSLISASDPFADEDSWTDTNVGNHEWGAEEQYSQNSTQLPIPQDIGQSINARCQPMIPPLRSFCRPSTHSDILQIDTGKIGLRSSCTSFSCEDSLPTNIEERVDEAMNPQWLSCNRRWRNTPGPHHFDLKDSSPAVRGANSFSLPNRSSMLSLGIRESLVSLNNRKSATSSNERAIISFDNTEGLVCFSNRESSCSSNRESLLSSSDSNSLLLGKRESLLFTSYVRNSSVSNKQESPLYPGKTESTTFSEIFVDSDIRGSTIMAEEVLSIHLPIQEVEASAQLMLSTAKPKPNSIVVAPPSPPWEPSSAISTYKRYSPYTLRPYTPAGDQFQRQADPSLTTMPVRRQFHKDIANDASGVLLQDGSLPFPLISESTSPAAEKQVASDYSHIISHAPTIQQDDRPPKSNGDSDIKLYLWTQPGRSTPIKLFVRLVGEHGNKVMVRVGGGWVDLGDVSDLTSRSSRMVQLMNAIVSTPICHPS